MVLIYNLSGLLIGVAGVAVGLMMFVGGAMVGIPPTVTLGLGVLAIAIVWIAAGIWWRRTSPTNAPPRAWPALFFIPLPIAGVLVGMLSMMLLGLGIIVELIGGETGAMSGSSGSASDPRASLFMADERTLDSAAATGDTELSKQLLAALDQVANDEIKSEYFHIFTAQRDDRTLVLVKAPNLKKFSKEARKQLLDVIVDLVSLDSSLDSSSHKVYVGAKGKLSFGAVRTPTEVKIGSLVSTAPLYEFYGSAKELAARK